MNFLIGFGVTLIVTAVSGNFILGLGCGIVSAVIAAQVFPKANDSGTYIDDFDEDDF